MSDTKIEKSRLDVSFVKSVVETLHEDPTHVVSENAFQAVDFQKLVLNHAVVDRLNHIFSNQIDDESEVMDQESAGLCWMCGGLTMCRRSIMKFNNLDKNFHLSINHLLFWDKLERCNYFIEFIIRNKHLKFNSRTIDRATSNPISDGGYWHTFYDLVSKYGLVPDTVFRRRVSGKSTSGVNNLLKYKLREFASIVMSPNREGSSSSFTNSELENLKEKFLSDITTILVRVIGRPIYPDESFGWTFATKKKKTKVNVNVTPIEFYKKYCPVNFSNYVPIITDPRPRHPYNQTYEMLSVKHMVTDRKQNRSHILLNLEFNDVVKLVMKQIDNNVPVWFSCDVGKYSNHKYNILDVNVYDYGSPFGTSFKGMNKGDRLDFNDSYASHVMCIVGYDLHDVQEKAERPAKRRKLDDDAKTDDEKDDYDLKVSRLVKFKVENSWGDIGDTDGFYAMTVEWFREYGYEVVINKEYLSPNQIVALNKTPIKMKQCDPLSHRSDDYMCVDDH